MHLLLDSRLPAPGSVMHIARNAQGQVTMLDQQGWHIEYQSYDKFNGLNLPILIHLQNQEHPFGLLFISGCFEFGRRFHFI